LQARPSKMPGYEVKHERIAIAGTDDLGRIVFTLIDVGLLASQPTDRVEDFERVYDFAEEFRAGYPWPGVERG